MPDPLRVVAHLDMDAFYVSVELRRRPELRGRPVIVAGTGPRSVVTTASYEARKYGVGSAIPAARARRLCPDGVFLAPDFSHYRAVSAEVMGIVKQARRAGRGGRARRGLPGAHRPAGAACRHAADRRRDPGDDRLERVGRVGPNKLVAKVASDAEKPNGFVVLTREQACARFATSPCELIPGIGAKTTERLRALGISTIAAARRRRRRRRSVGVGARAATHLRGLARFEHSGVVSEERKVVSESRERTFDTDISDQVELLLDPARR